MKTVLITGGSSGIGLALAKLFAADGHRLVLCAQNEDKLTEAVALLPAGSHEYIVQDLATLGAAAAVVQKLADKKLQIDILVNCAGFGTSGAFAATDLARETQEMQLNMVTLTQLTKLLLPGMIAAGDGRIVNVASIAAFMPGPYMAVYYATKAYVLSLSQALNEELRGSGVSVMALCPGPTATGFAATADTKGKGGFKGELPAADDVAAVAYAGFTQGKRVVIPGWKFKVLRAAVKFLPSGLVARYVARLQRPS
jgi:uncharacterized protein